eukprot:scaffold5987_cov203-Amphora_coffeaeformis.AAC.6
MPKRTKSPYFTGPASNRVTPSPQSRSPYFAEVDHSSCYQCVEGLGSLAEALSGVAPPRPCGCPSSLSPCLECQQVIDPVVELFKGCHLFQNLYKKGLAALEASNDLDQGALATTVTKIPTPCWRSREVVLEDSVRHLCDKQCFLRAFQPYRTCYDLHKRVKSAVTVRSEGSPLEGWTCRLKANSRPPKVFFENENGKKFPNIPQVLKSLAEQEAPDRVESKQRRMKSTVASAVSEKYPHLLLEVSVRSPLGLLEELLTDDPWSLLLSTVMLNRTSRAQVDHVLFGFLQRWPSPQKAVQASTEEIGGVIRSLGLGNKRAHGIQRFSADYLALMEIKTDPFSFSEEDVKGLHHCGAYAYDAYCIFIKRNVAVVPEDHALVSYVEYKSALFGGHKKRRKLFAA